MRLAWSILWLAACYAPSAFTGAPCDLTLDNCPGGQVCTAQAGGSFCTGPGSTSDASSEQPDASGMADLDGDDVADLDDNCPAKANAGQSNEDGDAFGDACDPCPPFVDGVTPLDADGDGVGDACDPAPTVSGDQIVHFEGFASGIPADWSVTGSITAFNGDLVAAGTATQSAILGIAEPPATRVQVWASTTMVAFSGGSLAGVGVVARRLPTTDDVVACQLVGTTNGGTQKLRVFGTGGNGGLIAEDDHGLTVGATYVLELRRDGTSYQCAATNPMVEIAGVSTANPAQPEVGFRARNATAAYHWIMVVTGP